MVRGTDDHESRLTRSTIEPLVLITQTGRPPFLRGRKTAERLIVLLASIDRSAPTSSSKRDRIVQEAVISNTTITINPA
jgi:hypothetical protein